MKRKVVLILLLMFCMTVSMFAIDVNAADTATTSKIDDCSKVFKAYTAERATTYLEGDNTYPTKEGYVFAGWYTTDELPENDDEKAAEYAVEGSVPEGVSIVYALFVPDDVLTVQAQVSVQLIDNEVTADDAKRAIRFVTTVDSLLYKEVGFELSYEVVDEAGKVTVKRATSVSDKVYTELYEADSNDIWDKEPYEEFCGASKYFKACTVKNVPESYYTTEFTVKPFWTTLSGDKVYGETATKTIEEGCLRKEVYVSSTPNIAKDSPYYGTYDNPYATLDYAIAHVKDGGTVRVKDSLTVETTTGNKVELTEHGKTITITGYDKDDDAETLHFPSSTHKDTTTNTELYIRDNITFTGLDLTFSEYVFANGHTVVVESDVNLLNTTSETANNLPYIYGGGKTEKVSSTCLKLYSGSYSIIYGGAHEGTVDGNTYVEIGEKVNPEAQTAQHDARDYVLYGGCRKGTVTGDTKVVVKEGAKVEYLYGGGNNDGTIVEGATYVEFAGQAYGVYGGSFKGTNGDTHIKMTGGTVYQVLGGCEQNSMTGNVDIQVLGGTVKRRLYGGCYNAHDNSWGTSYHVTGNIFVSIGTDATLALDSEDDKSLYALTRDSVAYDSEKGVFIFNDYENSSSNISKIGPDSSVQLVGVSTKTHHYQVNASAGGKVTAADDCIYIEPKDNNKATVRLDSATGTVVYYAEEAGYYPLPDLENGVRKIYVTFDETVATDFVASAAAKISTGNDLYAYYATLDEAIAAADKVENATITAISATNLASISIADSENGTVTSSCKNCLADETVTLTVIPDDGYYCSALSVTRDDEAVTLNEELTIAGTTYTFDTEAGAYTVEATFAKKVFETPSSSKYTLWDILQQNTSSETISNDGKKISGTISATTQSGAAGNNTVLTFVDEYTDMDLTLTVKEDSNNSTGNTPETRITFDFGDNRVFRISVYEYSGTVVIRENSSGVINKRLYAFTNEQEANYRSSKGVELRIVKIDTQIFLYIDGEECAIGAVNNGGNTTQYYEGTKIDLADFYTDNPITGNTPASVNIRRVGDEGSKIDMPYSIANEVTPVGINISDTANGTVTKNSTNYFAGDTVTLTVTPNTGYYCSGLSVTEDGDSVALNEKFVLDGTTYTFNVENGSYTVEPNFAKRIFKKPSGSATSWDLLTQNQSEKTLTNGGTEITGTIYSTTTVTENGNTPLYFSDETYTDIDWTLNVKDDPSTDAGYTPETMLTFDLNDSRVFRISVVRDGDNVILRELNSVKKTLYKFTTDQATAYATTGVELRIVRYDTKIFLYIDGEECAIGAEANNITDATEASTYYDKDYLDLSEIFTDVTGETTATLSIRRRGDYNVKVKIPFTIRNVITPTVHIQETTNGAVTKDKAIYSAGDTVTLTVTPNTGYYCSSLSVTKDGEAVALNEDFVLDEDTYTIEVEEGAYTVDATFAKRVFKTPTSSTKTVWDLLEQNTGSETLANGGTKISGTIYATAQADTATGYDTLSFYSKYTDIDLTLTVKNDPSSSTGSTPETIITIDCGVSGKAFQIGVTELGGGVIIRGKSGVITTRLYQFSDEQAANYRLSDGAELRIVKCGTEIVLYVDGQECTIGAAAHDNDTRYFEYDYIDLGELSDDAITATSTASVNIRRWGDEGAKVAMPFSITDKVSPVKVEVYDENSTLVTSGDAFENIQNIDLNSNETYTVILASSGFETTGYFKISFVDHVTNETMTYYTPALTSGENFEFTYQNGIFETVDEMSTISWENRIKATKDVLTVEVASGEPTETTIEAGAELGREPLAKPSQTIIETTWTDAYAVRSNHDGNVTDSADNRNKISKASAYSYTEVITIAKKGTRITFTDDKKSSGSASAQVYVISSWKYEADKWVIDLEGANIVGDSGNGNSLIETVSSDGKKITYSYVTSKDNENIRLCYNSKDKEAYPEIYSLYTGETGTAEEIDLAEDTSTWLVKQQTGETYLAYKDLFEGKTISIIGDSYFYGKGLSDAGENNSKPSDNVWPALLAAKYGMTLNNYGISGSTISNYAGANFDPMVDRWEAAFADDTPDIIIVEGGRNDYNKNVPMGELGTLDKATMIGATEYLISSLQKQFPGAVIIGTTCWEVGGNRNSAGYYCSDYGRAFHTVCEHLGVSFINSMDSDTMGVYMTNENFRKRFCIAAGDPSHLNEKGMKLVLPVFEQKIYEICNK